MIYVHLADGFEEVEALTIVDLLRRAEIEVQSVSIMDDLLVCGAHDICVNADVMFSEADYESCEMIVLPGGGAGTQRLLAHEGLKANILDFADNGKWVVAICAAPMVLAKHGILEGKKATIYQGMESELSGALYEDSQVVHDGKIITSQGPGTAMAFALYLIGVLKGADVSEKIKKDLMLKA